MLFVHVPQYMGGWRPGETRDGVKDCVGIGALVQSKNIAAEATGFFDNMR